MLIDIQSYLHIYVIARDFGFAPNPFFGTCTLATCKPDVRKSAKINDWVLGVAGSNLDRNIYRHCILLMKVTEKLNFQQYWDDERFVLKKPCRNGSLMKMVGDNIYHKDANNNWKQEDSHHSMPDGSINSRNLSRDTGRCEHILVSNKFFYFGKEAIKIDLESIKYKSGLGFKKMCLDSEPAARALIESVYLNNKSKLNMVVADPCQFEDSFQRVDQATGKLSS